MESRNESVIQEGILDLWQVSVMAAHMALSSFDGSTISRDNHTAGLASVLCGRAGIVSNRHPLLEDGLHVCLTQWIQAHV